MSNYDQALRVLEQARRPGDLRIHPNDAVEALAQAGLLMPEPPEPDALDRKGWPHWKLHGYGPHKDTIHVEYLAGGVYINSPACYMSAHPKDAAALARVIHAAAYYPKGWTQA
ncbi:hypothetical protein [Corynebacterium hiratae]|uniref:Uncharacterized protein n=1 Tax=Corynebacterium aurimucosum TaxID=169292 RepID=A0A6I3KAS6_9CORY|nr:hypothetical protein [Corynebacterium aurimucosum]MTD91133.1 hypothetical protein [Corynebacterium aurimucosum]